MSSEMPPNVLPNGVLLKDVMKKWSTIPGFPEIKVTRNYNTANNNTITLEQSQFLLPPYPDRVTGLLWYVPFTLTTENSPSTSTRFYRVNYDDENWKLLSEALPKLTNASRAILIDDALNLARGGRLDYSIALDVLNLLPNETNFVPWSAALNGLGYLYDRFSNDTETRKVVEEYIRDKFIYVYTYVKGFSIGTTEAHEFALTRQLILHWACRVDHELCINEAKQQFQAWRLRPNPNPIDPDVRRVSYCTGMRIGGQTEFDLLETRYPSSSIPDKQRIIYAMGCANETDILAKYLRYSITASTPATPFQGREVWDGGLIEVGKAFSEDLAPKLNTQNQLEQLEHMVMFSTLGEAEDGVKIAIRTLNETLVWQENYHNDVFRLMGGNTPSIPGTAASIRVPILILILSLSLITADYFALI
ncbi:hypothetical protein B566_EDAN002874 [Ephemera danica]|nr:hypothetical protein B566_EDAN002874 [Ephemera danica]